jgi:tight adherence protein B
LSTPPHGWLSEVTAAATSAGNVAAVLRRAARLPGAEDLSEVAACWVVAQRSGAGLAAGLETVAASMAQRENFRDRLDADLAGVRAGGWLLGALPVFGLVLGGVLGARPLAVIFGTRIGGVVCLAGLLLDALGVLWLRRMIRSVRATS